MKIIPAIDIIDGKCVRLSKGDYDTKKIYNENPLEVAKEFESFGIQYLHLVDLDGAKSKHIVNQKVLETIAKETSLEIDFGGGLKTLEDIETAFNSGAKQITIGSIAVQDPDPDMGVQQPDGFSHRYTRPRRSREDRHSPSWTRYRPTVRKRFCPEFHARP